MDVRDRTGWPLAVGAYIQVKLPTRVTHGWVSRLEPKPDPRLAVVHWTDREERSRTNYAMDVKLIPPTESSKERRKTLDARARWASENLKRRRVRS